MQKLKILNTREVKKIKELLMKQFGCTLQQRYVYLRNEKNRVFVVSQDLGKIELENLRIDRIGLYFAEIKETSIRLSKEGSQLLVKENDGEIQNIVDLNKEEVEKYFKGDDLERDLGEKRYIVLRYEKEILGCASYKEGKILNFLPKIHRGTVII